MKTFSDFHLPTLLADQLERMSFTTPTPIQEQAIPPALEGRDILGSAQTGTGKTGAFMIPLITKLLADERSSALVMAPTRELASQVMAMTQKLTGPKSGIRTALLIGGEPMPKQFKQLDARPRLIIGTPGRINDHCRRNKSLLDTTNFLVLDEADRMLDMGFSMQIDSVLQFMPKERQTLMFSATFSDAIIKFAKAYQNNPVRVAVKSEGLSADKIQHNVIKLRGDEKFDTLVQELDERKGSIIIFVKTKRSADQMAKRLCALKEDTYVAEAIHGDLRQRQRDRTINGFRLEKFRILVATDIAARGLDIPHIEHVINFDLPQVPEDYIHRIGRTARAGAEGAAVCFVTPQDGRMWSDIQRLVFPNQPRDFANDTGGGERGRGGNNRRGGGGYQGRNRSDGGEGRSSFGGGAQKQGSGNWGNRERNNNHDERPAFNKERGDRPQFQDRSDRPARQDRNDRPAFNKERGDRPQFQDRSDRPARQDRNDRPAFNNDRNDRPARSDRPARDDRQPASNEGRNFAKAPYGEKRSYPKREGGFENRAPRPEGREFGNDRSRNFRDNREVNGNTKDNPNDRGGFERGNFGDKPAGKKFAGKAYAGVGNGGSKPYAGKPKPQGSGADRNAGGNKPFSKPQGGKPQGKKPFRGNPTASRATY
jgi:superfamily II DNA/RNA helicase